MKKVKLGGRTWLALVLIGLVGQFAWTIENMYFNVFLYQTISTDPRYIADMVAWSAASATLTTLLMGALSDRIGKRKALVVGGYLLWGLATAAFGLVTVENATHIFGAADAVAAAATLVIVLDCLMTFFGSTANDAAFNAWVTDVTEESNRGRAESVLAILPLISMLVIFGLFDGMTQRGEWQKFFFIFGGLVTAVGVLSLFIMKEPPLTPRKDNYFGNLVYGLRPTVVAKNRELYLSFAAFALFSIAVQVFFPYLIIYMQNYLHLDNYAIVLGVVLLFASLVSVAAGRFIDRAGKLNFVLPAALVMFVGLLGMYFVRDMVAVIVAGCVMMSGYMLVSATLNGIVRDHTPEGLVGHFQGIRMIFIVMIPMIIGPFIGSAVIKGSDMTYMEMGQLKSVPTPGIFLAAAVVVALVIIPVIALRKQEKNT